jgi:hypothetical protein
MSFHQQTKQLSTTQSAQGMGQNTLYCTRLLFTTRPMQHKKQPITSQQIVMACCLSTLVLLIGIHSRIDYICQMTNRDLCSYGTQYIQYIVQCPKMCLFCCLYCNHSNIISNIKHHRYIAQTIPIF